MSEKENRLEECGVCHALHPVGELVSFDGELVCTTCLDETTAVCARCGERMWRDDDQAMRTRGICVSSATTGTTTPATTAAG